MISWDLMSSMICRCHFSKLNYSSDYCRKKFTDKENQEVLKKIRDEMKTLNKDTSPIDIRGKLHRIDQAAASYPTTAG